ncbi:hypothetical protein STCU_08878 [Strigomonas culicis]|uniref:PIH1 domain-containing protein 1 n=1 Tax=Strigomonas culicis TaxID=28005 RepID=S9VCB2_9TRYP|nr:hypothetical protein STCU_08878 [Strigomonas culicis]|eukprot:EPY20695.1 hypothetical protein STCU_08878 [Strigomonas culicis]
MPLLSPSFFSFLCLLSSNWHENRTENGCTTSLVLLRFVFRRSGTVSFPSDRCFFVMASKSDPSLMANELLKNPQFLEVFQRAMKAEDGSEGAIPKEGDPNRAEWLERLQSKLQAEALKDQKKNLEQVNTDENGEWCFVMPEPGFCVKCFTQSKYKIFLNICKHEKIAEPMPMPGQANSDEIQYRIPLSCGQAKPEKDKQQKECKVYDVIVSPKTITKCEHDNEFKRLLVAIAMQWIKQKYEPNLNDEEYKNLNFKVKGKLDIQRIRLGPGQKGGPGGKNAMADEIKLPEAAQAATKPTTAPTGPELIQEVEPAAPAPEAARVLARAKLGTFDWRTYDEKPSECMKHPYFKEAVPQYYYIELYIPGVSSIKEVEVSVSRKQVSLAYVDSPAEPFLTESFDYPVATDEVEEAKFVKSKNVLKLKIRVHIEKDLEGPRHAKDAMVEEEEEAQQQAARRQKEMEEARERQARLQQQEEAVLTERKNLVADLAAVQGGELPASLKDDIDHMEKEQMVAFLHRIEQRIQKGDAVDTLLEKLPPSALSAVSDYVRGKLHLEPLAKPSAAAAAAADTKKKVSFKEGADAAAAQKAEETKTERMEYNYAKQSEEIFGVAFHNRYLFALDSETLS